MSYRVIEDVNIFLIDQAAVFAHKDGQVRRYLMGLEYLWLTGLIEGTLASPLASVPDGLVPSKASSAWISDFFMLCGR